MLYSGLHIPALWSRPGAYDAPTIPRAPSDSEISLSGLMQAGPATGFTAEFGVDAYSATEGRYRLAPTGFAVCGPDEERLCYDADGTFRGQYLQGADTYYSAPWHDPSAPHNSSASAYLTKSSGSDTIAYAGSHAAKDIFGGTGGGVRLTQASTANSFFTAPNVKAAGVSAGDIVRYHAIVCIENATGAGAIRLRGAGALAFAFEFHHDADGHITGLTENWTTYRAGFHDMGPINGKRWFYLWLDRAANKAGDYQVGIGFEDLQQGRTLHVCELMIQRNPATAPAAVPVCAASKTFAADTLHTSYAGIGYSCLGLAMSRSQVARGKITAPSVPVGVPYEPLETRIVLHETSENADRTGILHNVNEALYNRPWRTPVDFEVYYGPSYFPDGWLTQSSNVDACTNATISPVFQARRDLRPILGRHGTSRTYLAGTLRTDGCIFLGVGDPVTEYWQQTDIRSFSTSTSFPLGAGSGILARNCLAIGGTLHTTRARHEIQQDEDPANRVYTGEFIPELGGDGSIDLSGTRFHCMARLGISAVDAAIAVALDLSGTCFDYFWSDPIYYSRGTFDAPRLSDRFHGRITLFPGMSMWQSRKQIEVDTGGGYIDFSDSGLALRDLPHGYLAKHVGTYDFDTETLDPAPDPNKAVRIRYYACAAGVNTSRPGYEWQSDQIDYGTHHAHPDQGDVFEVDDGKGTRVRFYYDSGYYSSGPTWNVDPNPALLNTGTHADNEQVNRQSVTLTNATIENLVFLNRGQGLFHTGDPGLPANGSDIYGNTINGVVAVLDGVANAHRFDHSRTANATETLFNAVFVQAYSDYRYSNGNSIYMSFGAAGPNNTLQLGSNVWIATSHADGTGDTGGGTTVGTVNFIELPRIFNFDEYDSPLVADARLDDLLDPDAIHASGQAKPVADPWSFTFAPTAAAVLGFDPNAVLTVARGSHAEWDDVIADIVAAYLREPDHHAEIASTTEIGTTVFTGVSATRFHAQYGGNGQGLFAIADGELRVASELTGEDRIFVLRGDNDETFVVDVS
ncbi:hypothetical protein [Aurantiacibacter poecillastricola]|uniref:hypothetical protein n=1 Tax=Aurantiacibacter poecillastricola TaxID=3064385 RepID=UPI00273FF69B|nr:hypothetical protein [Aurantiacibacter sp. 219JJ12-13]MDP5260707.1 hypothetical protein [Aurantiacibacter sp. 219JJ12-13]